MIDPTGRVLDYLRVSLIDRCNLRCVYCMPAEGVFWKPHAEILRLEETLKLCEILCGLGIRKIKLTGGEPLIRKNMPYFVRRLRQAPNLQQITMTSNAHLLPGFLDSLGSEAADLVAGLNISLNALEDDVYARLTRRGDLSEALLGLKMAVESGIPVKINCVPIKNANQDLVALARLAEREVKAVRFIELMPMGVASDLEGMSMEEVRRALEESLGPLTRDHARLGNGPAQYYSVPGFQGKIGFISALSEAFCSQCNRLRLGADGRLKACLASDVSVDLRELLRAGAGQAAIEEAILDLAARKPVAHRFARGRHSEGDSES
ncbi:MAG: GTP 3',8-cyclase MoaA, partial [Deltaproteobacteria bacterium]|nr:GTP 3',8-cyclase MoaA [Deltaproteobacteria bacterium]